MMVRTAVGAVCASALLASTITPAYAGGYGGDNGELRVKVCKYVYDHDDEEFDIDVWTDDDDDSTTLGHRDCERFRLDYSDNRFWLDEDVDTDDWDTWFRISGDYEKARAYKGGRLKVWFDDDEDDPYLKIKVYNREDDRHHDDDY